MTQTNRTALNVSIVTAASSIQIVVQFLFQRVIAGWFGAAEATDAHAAALALPTMFAAIVSGSLSYILVPELVRKFSADDDRIPSHSAKSAENLSAWQLASFVACITILISAACSLLLFLIAEPVCNWLYGEMKADGLRLTSELLRILSVQVLLNGVISWAQAVHHSRHHFVIPALGGVIGTTLSLAVAFQFGSSIYAVAWAINLGSLLSVLIQVVPLGKYLAFPRADNTAILRLCNLLWPLLLGASLMRVDPLIDRVLASKLVVDSPGAIAYINFAQRILAALLAIGTSSLAIVAFPQLAQHVDGNGTSGFARHFALAFRRLILLVVPIALGFSLFSVRIIRDMLQTGEFTEQDSNVVGWLIVTLMGVFLGASCAELLARGFYVLGDTKSPTVIGVIALVVSWGIKISLFSQLGLWGITIGVSAYCVLSAGGMAWWLSRNVKEYLWTNCFNWLVQSLIGSLIACGGCYLVYQLFTSGTWLAAPVGVLLYFSALLWLKNEDARYLWDSISRRIVG